MEWEEVACDLCGCGVQDTFVDVETRSANVSRSMKLVKCLGCGLVYLNPRPTQERIGEDGLGGYGTSFDHTIIRQLAPLGLVDVILPSVRRGKLLDVGCGDGERAD